jgi:hypothetical protein
MEFWQTCAQPLRSPRRKSRVRGGVPLGNSDVRLAGGLSRAQNAAIRKSAAIFEKREQARFSMSIVSDQSAPQLGATCSVSVRINATELWLAFVNVEFEVDR